jgi:glycosyltransferase involved in cell wall biosynthesis
VTPKISVILPVHNRADVLPRAIESVLDQELREFELIVVDDGSTDDSAQVAQSFGDDRIQLIRLDHNRGGNVARNQGIRAAGAPLIAFLDSDDRYLPNKLAWVAAEFERRPKLDLLVDSFIKVQPPGARKAEVVRRNPVIDDRELFRTALFTRQLWKATPAISVKRDIALEAGLFDETLRRLQDFD